MSTLLGVGGAMRNASAALLVGGEVRAVCEQERLVRVRGIGLNQGAPPVEAIDEVLALARLTRDDVTAYVVSEPEVRVPETFPVVVVDHHRAHAAAAFFTSPFERAAVLVCDRHAGREMSVWMGDASGLVDVGWESRGHAFATVFSGCAEALGFEPGQEHRLEALARLGQGLRGGDVDDLFQYRDRSLWLHPEWKVRIGRMAGEERRSRSLPAATACAVQRRLGEVLLELVRDVRATFHVEALCLGGGLFFNTYFNTAVASSQTFADTFVPINPGNAGLAVGGPLAVASQTDGRIAGRLDGVSPFLGPGYDSESIKATLDSCKLSYEYVSEGAALEAAVAALTRGHIVGWFQGRMEWGPRALGHRSILADPRSPYVLDNLNCFLRKRERSRGVGLSVLESDSGQLFSGPPCAPFMQYDYSLRGNAELRHALPDGAQTLRVQTVRQNGDPFFQLLKRMHEATGVGVLVNTSFNAFREPIVCTPSDAVRVFYGTGLDLLVIGQFILRK